MRRLGSLVVAFAMLFALSLSAYAAGGLQAVPKALSSVNSSSATRISAATVSRLALAWHIDNGATVTSPPFVDNGKIFFDDWSGNVIAANAFTGKILWEKKLESPMMKWPWHGFDGHPVLGNGLLYTASVEGNAYALDPMTGAVKWQTHFADQPDSGTIAAPLFYKNTLYIGMASVDEPLAKMGTPLAKLTFRGEVAALDATTGQVKWRFYTAKPPYNGDAIWGGLALDPASDTLYFGTGNNYHGAAGTMSDAMVAINASTGQLRWFHQVTENDVWTPATNKGPDYDFGSGPQLFHATIDGRPTVLVGAGAKNGVFYTWNAYSGKFAWSSVIGNGGVGGGIRDEAAIGADRLLLWSNNGWNDGSNGTKATQVPLNVKAIDPDTGHVIWADKDVAPATSDGAGFLANNVYFVGSLDGKIRGFDSSNGKLLWTSPQVASAAGALKVSGSMLYFGGSVPSMFGGVGPSGLFAYKLG